MASWTASQDVAETTFSSSFRYFIQLRPAVDDTYMIAPPELMRVFRYSSVMYQFAV